MNLEFLIAKKMALGDEGSFSSFIVKIAIAAVAISLATMIIATAVIQGFKVDISDKVFGFWGHIHINNFDNDRSQESLYPIVKDTTLMTALGNDSRIKHVQSFANKTGILKKEDNIDGIIFYGVSSDFDWTFFQNNLVSGEIFQVEEGKRANDIIISQYTSDRLGLSVGDDLIAYMNKKQRPSPRKLKVVGIYKTGMQEYDEQYALIDIGHIQRMNGWGSNEVGGLSVFVKNRADVAEVNENIYYQMLSHEQTSVTLEESYPNIFEWLNLQNMNERILLGLLFILGAVNMVTALLILILERTRMVGILKSLGASNFSIQKVFLYNAAYIILIGLIIGNIIGLSLAFLQAKFGIVKLPEESYYLDVAPVVFNPVTIVLLNVGVLVFCLLVLFIPSILVRYINPIKAIRFD